MFLYTIKYYPNLEFWSYIVYIPNSSGSDCRDLLGAGFGLLPTGGGLGRVATTGFAGARKIRTVTLLFNNCIYRTQP